MLKPKEIMNGVSVVLVAARSAIFSLSQVQLEVLKP